MVQIFATIQRLCRKEIYSGRQVKRPESSKKKPQKLGDGVTMPSKQINDQRNRIGKYLLNKNIVLCNTSASYFMNQFMEATTFDFKKMK